MYNQPYIIPRYYTRIPITNRTPFTGLNNIIKGIKNFNWTNLINNTSKTLGIINQTIPLTKQIGPTINNLKSIIKLASVFKDETTPIPTTNTKNNSETTTSYQNNTYTESPTFFIN